jgi:hypothetical protein
MVGAILRGGGAHIRGGRAYFRGGSSFQRWGLSPHFKPWTWACIDSEILGDVNCKKTFKFKIGVLWATIAQKQQISGDFI